MDTSVIIFIQSQWSGYTMCDSHHLAALNFLSLMRVTRCTYVSTIVYIYIYISSLSWNCTLSLTGRTPLACFMNIDRRSLIRGIDCRTSAAPHRSRTHQFDPCRFQLPELSSSRHSPRLDFWIFFYEFIFTHSKKNVLSWFIDIFIIPNYFFNIFVKL